VGTRREMARWLACLYATAASLALLAVALPHGHDVDASTAVFTGLPGFPLAAALWLAGERVPRWLIHAMLLLGTLMISVGTHTAGHGRMAGSASGLYLWIAIYAGYFFPWQAVALHLAAVTAGYAAVLATQHEAAAPALLVGMTGTLAVTAFVINSLAGRLRGLAATDPLTGLPNRRGWEEALDRELARTRRRESPLCVAVLDLDGFKALNDELGHSAGDRLLREASATWLSLLRESDILARYGGDEFGVILPDCYPNRADEIITRLCQATPTGATCSAGVAWADGVATAGELIDRADRALYRAKGAGGNQAVFEQGRLGDS
jgi:diguanylate cyclase (GGDEF)-like protein